MRRGCRRPVLLDVFWRAGRHRYLRTGCGDWGCAACRAYRLRKLIDHVALVAGDSVAWGRVPAAYVSAARLGVRRAGSSYLAVSLEAAVQPAYRRKGARRKAGELWVLADKPVSGRGWRLEEGELLDVLAELNTWSLPRPVQTTWRGWASPPRPSHEEAEYVWKPRDEDELWLYARLAGYDPNAEYIPDAAAVVERLKAVRNGDGMVIRLRDWKNGR